MNPVYIITILIIIGLVLMALEVYVPGFILGSIGVVLMLVAAGITWSEYGLNRTLFVVGIELAGSLVTVMASLKVFPETRVGRKMILAATQTDQHAALPRPEDLVGQEGVAHTVLRPSGTAVIDGNRLDVVAESGMIESGQPIKVIDVRGARIVVREQ